MDPLVERQRALQEEAAAVLDDLELLPLLQTLGDPVKVGSVALGLMVARDIDLTILCPELDAGRVFEVVQPLVAHPRVRELRFRNDTGHWNDDSNFTRSTLSTSSLLPPRLTPEARLAILRIKDDCLGRPWYSSHHITTAVLDHGVRTTQAFRAHLEGAR